MLPLQGEAVEGGGCTALPKYTSWGRGAGGSGGARWRIISWGGKGGGSGGEGQKSGEGIVFLIENNAEYEYFKCKPATIKYT